MQTGKVGVYYLFKMFFFFLILLERTVTCERQLMFAVETG